MASSSQTETPSITNVKSDENPINEVDDTFHQHNDNDDIDGKITIAKELSVPVHKRTLATKQIKKPSRSTLHADDESNSETEVYDDSTTNFLWEAHSITVFVIGTSILFYFVFFETQKNNVEVNVKRGIIAMIYAFLAIGVTLTQNGPVIRPHPVFWRLFLCVCYLYELGLVFFLFQTVTDARKFLLYVDATLNKPLDYKNYAGSCEIWDPGHPDGPFHNVMDKMDIFVIGHLVGWFWKALIFRDVWITNVISFMFELLEYTFENQLPNFSECWWDHWILDFIICNGLGIYLGLKCLKYLAIKEYKWTGLWHIHTYKGRMKRVVGQFTPYNWVKFKWKPTKNLYHWFAVSLLVFISLLAELNTFYLKFVLWIPPDHPLVTIRLCFYAFWAFVGVREAYDYAIGKSKYFGQQACLLCAVVMTELMVVFKFGWDVLSIPFPAHVKYFWLSAFLLYIAFSVWKFQVKFPLIRQWMKTMLKEFTNKLLMLGDEATPINNQEEESDISSESDQ